MLEMHSAMMQNIRECLEILVLICTSDNHVLDSRHLVRLWLRNDELAWKTPKPLEQIWKTLYSVTPEEQRFPLEPEVRKREGGGTK